MSANIDGFEPGRPGWRQGPAGLVAAGLARDEKQDMQPGGARRGILHQARRRQLGDAVEATMYQQKPEPAFGGDRAPRRMIAHENGEDLVGEFGLAERQELGELEADIVIAGVVAEGDVEERNRLVDRGSR